MKQEDKSFFRESEVLFTEITEEPPEVLEAATGLRFFCLNEAYPHWCDYDQSVARAHMSNYGLIICHAITGEPIDNEFDLLEIEHVLGV